MLKLLVTLPVLVVALAAVPAWAEDKDKEKDEKKVGVYEIRTYYAAEGKMDALNKRFREHTLKLFEKHGMTNIGYWQAIDPKDGKQVLIYIIGHESREAAKKNWEEFQKDPDWIKAKADSEKDGELVDKFESVYTKATDYSPIK